MSVRGRGLTGRAFQKKRLSAGSGAIDSRLIDPTDGVPVSGKRESGFDVIRQVRAQSRRYLFDKTDTQKRLHSLDCTAFRAGLVE